MKYCKRCLYPNTKPDLFFDNDGICSACTAYGARSQINWIDLERQFRELVKQAISAAQTDGAAYDCIVPVSGGKDSHYQVLTALEYGLRVLAVTATTCSLSNIGRRNLDNIAKLGVDHIEITTNRQARRKLNKHALLEIGDISWPEHATIFTIPFIIAEQMDIPLILWGENPQNEYGGPEKSQQVKILNGEEWLNEFGGLNGLRVNDLVEQDVLSYHDAHFYTYPPCAHTINSVYLGSYFPWDGFENANIARGYGFEWYHRGVEGIGYAYENLDNTQTGLRDYLKYVKFGFGRATDLVCNHIRRGRLTRQEGIAHVQQWDGQWPATYLGRSLEEILGEVDVTIEKYLDIVNQFANKKLFRIYEHGVPVPKFLIGEDYETK